VPRQAALGEHRNDHQLATVSQLVGRPGIYVAHPDDDLRNYLLEELDSPSHEDSSEAGRASLWALNQIDRVVAEQPDIILIELYA
ncbi:hypothetical protein AB9F39_37290, partial [Rhizobium leguminosarum]